MTFKKAIDIINGDIFVDDKEQLEAYETYFKTLGVTISNPDGTYKSIYDIFKEASDNFQNLIIKGE
jgi:uncharacterized protein affecting Mg2+/Co2+ transport